MRLHDSFPTFQKMRRRLWIVLPLLAVGAAVLWFAAFVDWHRHTILVHGVEREYLLYRPSSRRRELKPLVLAYHGFSGTAAGMADGCKLHELAGEKDFYLAYPEAGVSWLFFVPDGSDANPDVAFFDLLCDDLIDTYPIDPDRVYVVGMSRGGDFAVYLAQRRSDRIAAIVSQGACVAEAVDAARPFPLMFIVGTKDDRVPQKRFPCVPQSFRDRGHVVEVLRPENVGHRWHVPLNQQVWRFLSSHSLRQTTPSSSPAVVIRGTQQTEIGPHGEGNVYAPHILFENGINRMWYGGLGADGHDRIHYAESGDGFTWRAKTMVLEDETAHHVNDPTVVRVDDRYFMYYTVAASGVTDRIDVATSTDGVRWRIQGTALRPGQSDQWDGLLVGRPSVLLEDGQFKMWYDGRKDLPPGAPDADAPKSPTSKRSVGLATSRDGLHWTKHDANPVFGRNAGGVHVVRWNSVYLMVYESHAGTMLAQSPDGLSWKSAGMLAKVSGTSVDKHGHVTPFLLLRRRAAPQLFVGAARASSWDRNCIARIPLDGDMLGALLSADNDDNDTESR